MGRILRSNERRRPVQALRDLITKCNKDKELRITAKKIVPYILIKFLFYNGS